MAEITRESKRIVRFIIHDLIEGWTRDTYTPSPRAHKYTNSHYKMISQNIWKKQCRISAPESVRNKKKKKCKVRKLYWLNIKKKETRKVNRSKHGMTQIFPTPVFVTDEKWWRQYDDGKENWHKHRARARVTRGVFLLYTFGYLFILVPFSTSTTTTNTTKKKK